MVREGVLKAAKILIVDDDAANARLLERMLRKADYGDVTTETDPRRVIDLCDEMEPDLLLLDLHMPGMDGFEVMEGLRQAEAERFLPILVLTGDTSVEVKRRALLVGAKDFLTKPVDHFELLLRIWNLLETRVLYLELQRRKAAAD